MRRAPHIFHAKNTTVVTNYAAVGTRQKRHFDRWVRFWYQGELLPLPAELEAGFEKAKREADHEKRRAHRLQRQVDKERTARLALERELERLRAGTPKNRS